MTGIIIMIGSVFIFIIGLLLYNSNNRTIAQTQIIPEPAISKEIAITPPKIIENDNELENAIEMAKADGVLTKNERDIIRKIAEQKGLDFNEVINNVEQQIAESNDESETELIDINAKKGYDFEKFIVQKFNRDYFKVLEWAGDKYVKGVYSKKNEDPDFLLELNLNGEIHVFAVECKWRQSLLSDGIKFAEREQYQRYVNYGKTKNIPVFVAVGIGGKGNAPNQLYVIPLSKLNSNFISREKLEIFEKKITGNFFYDFKNGYIN